MDELMAVIKMFAGTFAPQNYAYCNGQTLAISSNSALFSLLGTTYGGDGVTTFNLPDLQGRVPVGTGNGAGLSPIVLGQIGGNENITLQVSQMPSHSHTLSATLPISNNNATSHVAAADGSLKLGASVDGSGLDVLSFVSDAAPASYLTIGGTTQLAGGSQPVAIRSPYLGMNYIICTQGVYPSRN
jgi:microcystin-dependent protein